MLLIQVICCLSEEIRPQNTEKKWREKTKHLDAYFKQTPEHNHYVVQVLGFPVWPLIAISQILTLNYILAINTKKKEYLQND